jgi:hypothetical protein
MDPIEIAGTFIQSTGAACAYLNPRQCCHCRQLLVSIGDIGGCTTHHKGKARRQCTPFYFVTGHSSDRDPEHARMLLVVVVSNVHDLIEQ